MLVSAEMGSHTALPGQGLSASQISVQKPAQMNDSHGLGVARCELLRGGDGEWRALGARLDPGVCRRSACSSCIGRICFCCAPLASNEPGVFSSHGEI